jgi:hypothetical protein
MRRTSIHLAIKFLVDAESSTCLSLNLSLKAIS